MMNAEQNKDVISRCLEMLNQRTAQYVDTFYAENAQWIEMPMPGQPMGRQGARDALREAAVQLLRRYPERQMSVRKLVAQGDQVVLEADWYSTPPATADGDGAAQLVTLRIISIFTLVDRLIVRHTDYFPG